MNKEFNLNNLKRMKDEEVKNIKNLKLKKVYSNFETLANGREEFLDEEPVTGYCYYTLTTDEFFCNDKYIVCYNTHISNSKLIFTTIFEICE